MHSKDTRGPVCLVLAATGGPAFAEHSWERVLDTECVVSRHTVKREEPVCTGWELPAPMGSPRPCCGADSGPEPRGRPTRQRVRTAPVETGPLSRRNETQKSGWCVGGHDRGGKGPKLVWEPTGHQALSCSRNTVRGIRWGWLRCSQDQAGSDLDGEQTQDPADRAQRTEGQVEVGVGPRHGLDVRSLREVASS